MDNQPKICLTEFDVATCSSYLQMIKAYIPYTDTKQQYIMAIFVRLAELMQTIEFYRNMPCPSPLSRRNHDTGQMIKDIGRYCSQKDAEILDMVSRFGSFNEMFKVYSAMNSAKEDSSSGSDIIKNFLSPEQQKKYESYKNLLNQ